MRMTITYLRRRYPAVAESKKTASKMHAEANPSILFQVSLVNYGRQPDSQRMESPAAPLPNDLLALHDTFSTDLFYLLIKKL